MKFITYRYIFTISEIKYYLFTDILNQLFGNANIFKATRALDKNLL